MDVNFDWLASLHVFIQCTAVTINASKDEPVIGFDDVCKDLETVFLFEALIYCIQMGGNYNQKANPLFPPNVFKQFVLHIGLMISFLLSAQFLVR